jgi:LmbE family N-acetylglucosaminyl deacetylase
LRRTIFWPVAFCLRFIAPHPDDETLGCSALLHEAAQLGIACNVICVTDGSRSHPNSSAWDRCRLARVRRAEIECAVAVLAPHGKVDHLGYRDCETPAGAAEAEHCVGRIDMLTPHAALVLAPWDGDPHIDHERTALLARRLVLHRPDLALLFYPVWGRFADTVPGGEVKLLAASPASRAVKRDALACHRTQMTRLIDDDPAGFVMSGAHQAHFLEHPEIFLAD